MMIKESFERKTRIQTFICSFHQMNPGVPYEGCTCSQVFSLEVPCKPDEGEREVTQESFKIILK